MDTPYYYDLLAKLVGRGTKGMTYEELSCHRKNEYAFNNVMNLLVEHGYVIETRINGVKGYKSTSKGNQFVIEAIGANRAREEARRDPNSIQTVYDRLETCWISLEKLLPENATEIKLTDALPCMRFVTVLVKDDDGHVAVANRCLRIKTGNQYLDANVKTFDWHWSDLSFTPTYWMPMPR